MVVAEWQLLVRPLVRRPAACGCRSASRRRARLSSCVSPRPAPTTAPTAHPEDVVGSTLGSTDHPQLRRAMTERRICREEDPRWYLGVPVRRETIPVTYGDRVIAVLSRETNLAVPRVPSSLEIAYLGDRRRPVPDGRRRQFPTSEPAAGRAHRPARRATG